MISNTIYSKGRDNFKDYTFSAREWSAPTMVSPKETVNGSTALLCAAVKLSACV